VILEKDIDEALYSIVKHVAKGLNLENIRLSDEINAMIDL
jgi:ribosomal protein L31E